MTCDIFLQIKKYYAFRDLISRVRFPELKSKGFQEVTCKLLLIEDIPSGLYVDLDQVASLHDFGSPVVSCPLFIIGPTGSEYWNWSCESVLLSNAIPQKPLVGISSFFT